MLLSAAASGLAVLAVTWLADRLGGTLGGLLATAPVTSAAALLFLAGSSPNAEVGGNLLEGGRSLLAALLAMPVYFLFLKHTTGWLRTRILVGLTLFIAVFTGGTLWFGTFGAPGWLWILLIGALSVLYLFTFLQMHIPPQLLRGPKPHMDAKEAALRFLAGAGVILLVAWLRETQPALSTAWAIFPGTYLVTLGVLGFGHGAAYSGRACQGGALGGVPLATYLVVLHLVLPLREGLPWAVLAQLPAWLAYFAVLIPLWRWRQRVLAPKVPRTPEAA